MSFVVFRQSLGMHHSLDIWLWRQQKREWAILVLCILSSVHQLLPPVSYILMINRNEEHKTFTALLCSEVHTETCALRKHSTEKPVTLPGTGMADMAPLML